MQSLHTDEKIIIFNVSRRGQSLNRFVGSLYENGDIQDELIFIDMGYPSIPEEVYDRTYDLVQFINKADYAICFSPAHWGIIRASCEENNIDLPKIPIISMPTILAGENITPTLSRDELSEKFNIQYVFREDKEISEAEFTLNLLNSILESSSNRKVSLLFDNSKEKRKTGTSNFFRSQVEDIDVAFDAPNPSNLNVDGKHVLVTGNFDEYPDRKEIHTKLADLGAIIIKTVNKNTDFIFFGDGAGPSKYARAEKLRKEGKEIKFLSEADLKTLLG